MKLSVDILLLGKAVRPMFGQEISIIQALLLRVRSIDAPNLDLSAAGLDLRNPRCKAVQCAVNDGLPVD